MIRCIVVDDEKPARDELNFLLAEYEEIEVVKTFDSAKAVLKEINELDVNVAFVDINMPGMSGIDLADILTATNENFLIVFATAHNEYAVTAFELNAFDYLLKPISEKRLEMTISRIKERIAKKHNEKNDEGQKIGNIMFQRDGLLIPVKKEDIIYLKAESGSVNVHTKKGPFVTNHSLTELEKMLSEDVFFKCCRSFIINMDCIENIEPWFNRTYQVKLIGQKELIPISRNLVNEFKAKLHVL
jgi:two-component system LytT family response regulator/two-component system response regulator LytT